MTRAITMILTTVALCSLSVGCLGRIFSEGAGSATGASGKVGDSGTERNLTQYKSLRVEPITVTRGVPAPAEMPAMIQADLGAAAEKRGLARQGEPGLKLTGEIIHYETGSTKDTALGPLEEVIVHAILTDAQSGKVVAETNLTGRSRATSSSGVKNLSAGVGKALKQLLKDAGLKKTGEKDED
jgi:hypothetical protein